MACRVGPYGMLCLPAASRQTAASFAGNGVQDSKQLSGTGHCSAATVWRRRRRRRRRRRQVSGSGYSSPTATQTRPLVSWDELLRAGGDPDDHCPSCFASVFCRSMGERQLHGGTAAAACSRKSGYFAQAVKIIGAGPCRLDRVVIVHGHCVVLPARVLTVLSYASYFEFEMLF